MSNSHREEALEFGALLPMQSIRELLERLTDLDEELFVVLRVLLARRSQAIRLIFDARHELTKLELRVQRHRLIIGVGDARRLNHVQLIAQVKPLRGRDEVHRNFEIALDHLHQFENVFATRWSRGVCRRHGVSQSRMVVVLDDFRCWLLNWCCVNREL